MKKKVTLLNFYLRIIYEFEVLILISWKEVDEDIDKENEVDNVIENGQAEVEALKCEWIRSVYARQKYKPKDRLS